MARSNGKKKAPKKVAPRFTTIKVRDDLRRWIKTEAAIKGVPMYVLVEQLLAKGARGRHWEAQRAAS